MNSGILSLWEENAFSTQSLLSPEVLLHFDALVGKPTEFPHGKYNLITLWQLSYYCAKRLCFDVCVFAVENIYVNIAPTFEKDLGFFC